MLELAGVIYVLGFAAFLAAVMLTFWAIDNWPALLFVGVCVLIYVNG